MAIVVVILIVIVESEENGVSGLLSSFVLSGHVNIYENIKRQKRNQFLLTPWELLWQGGNSSGFSHFLGIFSACNRTYYGEWGSTYTLSLTSSTIAAALGLTHEQQLLAASQSDQPKDEVVGRKLLSPKERERGGGGKGGMRQLAAASRGERVKGESRAEVPQFVCQLTFAAAGDNFGDFVQVGKFGICLSLWEITIRFGRKQWWIAFFYFLIQSRVDLTWPLTRVM